MFPIKILRLNDCASSSNADEQPSDSDNYTSDSNKNTTSQTVSLKKDKCASSHSGSSFTTIEYS